MKYSRSRRQDLGACKGTTDAVRGPQSPLAPEGGASWRSFRRAQTIRAGAQKCKRGLSFGPGLAQGASGVRELVGEGRWLCGFFSFSLICEGPTVPSSLGLLVQVFDVLLHPGLAWVSTDQSPISGLEDDRWLGALVTGPLIIFHEREWDCPCYRGETAGMQVISWFFIGLRVQDGKSEEEGQGGQADPHGSGC